MSIFIETQSLSVALTFSLHIKNIDFLLMFSLLCPTLITPLKSTFIVRLMAPSSQSATSPVATVD